MSKFNVNNDERKNILEQHRRKGSSISEQIEDIEFEDDFNEYSDSDDFGDYEGDEETEIEAEKLSQKEPTYMGVGNKFGSFSDNNVWYDDQDKEYDGSFDFDYDEEEFDEFEPFYEKHGKDQYWFAPGEGGKKYFDKYKELHGGPFKVRTRRTIDEQDEPDLPFEKGPSGMRAARSRADFAPSGKREVELTGGVFGKYSEEIPPIVIRYMRKNPRLIIKRLYDIYGDKMFDYIEEED